MVMRTEIGLFPDWGNQWSLWRVGAISPDALGLSHGLERDLAEWTRVWQDELDPVFEVRWKNDEDGRKWVRHGRDLAVRVQAELSDEFCLVSNFDRYGPDSA